MQEFKCSLITTISKVVVSSRVTLQKDNWNWNKSIWYAMIMIKSKLPKLTSTKSKVRKKNAWKHTDAKPSKGDGSELLGAYSKLCIMRLQDDQRIWEMIFSLDNFGESKLTTYWEKS